MDVKLFEDDIEFKPKSKKMRLPEVCELIDRLIEEYEASDDLYYGKLFLVNGLSDTKLHYWRTTYPKSIKPRMNYIRELQEVKYNDILASTKSKNYQSTNLIWFGKTVLKRVEEAVKMKIEADKEVAENLNDTTISVSWSNDED